MTVHRCIRLNMHRASALLRRNDRTLLRHLEYFAIEGLELNGRILDVGGGDRSGYYDLIRVRGRLFSLNIDPTLRPTCIADFGKGLPIASGVCDCVLSFNTLEHIFADTSLLAEIVRVLKPGGAAHILVPFLYRVHASPDDYHRHTASFWEQALHGNGIPPEFVDILPLTFGPLAAPLSIVEFRIHRWIRRLARLTVILVTALKNRFNPSSTDGGDDLPLGYFIRAVKPSD
jgi:SAM-dependent methyltransferase